MCGVFTCIPSFLRVQMYQETRTVRLPIDLGCTVHHHLKSHYSPEHNSVEDK